jgi:hypothetical protein
MKQLTELFYFIIIVVVVVIVVTFRILPSEQRAVGIKPRSKHPTAAIMKAF